MATRPAGDPVALALVLQPQCPGRVFHAAVVSAAGERHEFASLSELVAYLVHLGLPAAPAGDDDDDSDGLR